MLRHDGSSSVTEDESQGDDTTGTPLRTGDARFGRHKSTHNKWQILLATEKLESQAGNVEFLLHILFRPWVILAITATFGTTLLWILALSKLHLSAAYPYLAISYVLIFIASILIWNEPVSAGKVLGYSLIVTGIVVVSRY